MASPDWQKVRDIFEKCIELPAAEREVFLQRECGGDEQLLKEVQRLLLGDESARSEYLEWPENGDLPSAEDAVSTPTIQHDSKQENQQDSDFPSTRATSASTSEHRQIGPYKLLKEIGHGGMGEVWLAQQTEPVERRVAIKLIKSQLTGKIEIARFEAERQALALMEHPNIAKVFEAGTTDDGLPYYVMEYINGISVTKFCDKHQLSIRDRLQVFIPICRAIQHAHQKGIIHRDLKPSNILVGESEGFPVPKVIDFGLAKATDHQRMLTDKTLFTEIGKVVGTLQYMSPEQAALNSNDIDSRTDIYSLGIVLYELLTGLTPLDRQTIKDKAILKVLEIIRQSDTPRPSYRLSSSGETITSVSKQRQIEPKKLQSILRGELDWVVMKSLEKDRNRRYDSASSFADDIHRFLINEPVTARPPSSVYRVGKFVARNRLLVTSASIIVVLAVIGVGALFLAYSESQENLEIANRLAKTEEASITSINELTESVAEDLTGARIIDTSGYLGQIQDPLIRGQHASGVLLTRIGLYLRQTGANRDEFKKWFYKAIDAFSQLDANGELEDAALIAYATALDNAGLEANADGNKTAAIEHHENELKALVKMFELEASDKDYARKRLALAHLNLGRLANPIENNGRAIDYLLQLTKPDSESDLLLASCYSNRAEDRADPKDAETDMLRSIELFEKHGKSDALMRVYTLMSQVQKRLKKTKQEEHFRDKAITLAENFTGDLSSSYGLLIESANTFYDAGLEFHRKEELQKALENYEKGIPILERLAEESDATKSSQVYFSTYWMRAEALISLERPELAIRDLDVAIDTAQMVPENHDARKYLPYFETLRMRCRAATEPIKTAKNIDYLTSDIPNKADTILNLVAVYSLAAEAEKDDSNRQTWIDKSIEALRAVKSAGELREDLILELKTDKAYKEMRDVEEFRAFYDNNQ